MGDALEYAWRLESRALRARAAEGEITGAARTLFVRNSSSLRCAASHLRRTMPTAASVEYISAIEHIPCVFERHSFSALRVQT